MSERSRIHAWLMAGLEAVEPGRLTRDAMATRDGPLTILAIGKAAAAMCRGAAAAVEQVDGLCITSHEGTVPDTIELMIGDHPFPGEASLAAGRRAIEISSQADVALISGGGSSLCEVPADGLSIEFVAGVYERLLDAGSNIAEMNLVRSHLSRTKAGGLGPIPTFLLSDVGGAGPEVVSSGPTIGTRPDPARVISIMRELGVTVDSEVEDVVRNHNTAVRPTAQVVILADGRTAAQAISAAVDREIPTRVHEGWIEGDYEENLIGFIGSAEPGVTVAAGEPSVPARPVGRGGRNTHVALTAARIIDKTSIWFAALATDGVDGSSESAGAIVNGSTLARGGDPAAALAGFDSASYLNESEDLIRIGPTGTNVADVWLIWKPEDGPEPILSL